jgi:single-strand DNA-binding protein
MASFNRVILMGNLTRDPQLKYLPSNTAVCEFGLAMNHRFKDREGNQREEVCFVDVSAFGRGGEVINQYMAKGKSILIEGRLKLDTWTGQDGSKRSKHSVIVDNFTFVGDRGGPGGGGGSGGGQGGGYNRGNDGGQGGYSQRGGDGGGYESSYNDEGPGAPTPSGDDIPF